MRDIKCSCLGFIIIGSVEKTLKPATLQCSSCLLNQMKAFDGFNLPNHMIFQLPLRTSSLLSVVHCADLRPARTILDDSMLRPTYQE